MIDKYPATYNKIFFPDRPCFVVVVNEVSE